METATVFLIDPNKLFREGLKRLLEGSPFAVMAEPASLREGLTLAQQGKRPSLVILDPIGSDDADGMRRLRDALPGVPMVVLTGELCPDRLAMVLEAGADAYLVKDLSSDALIQSLRLVMLGEKVFPSHLAALLISGRAGRTDSTSPSGARKGLSQREVQILRHLLSGDSNKMIANQLQITEATVKVHLKSLLRKINASNRTQAAIWALNNGFAGDRAESKPGPVAKAL